MSLAVLSPLDTAFLRLESSTAPMHIASLTVLEGPASSLDEVRDLISRRLHRLPRYRQVVREAPLSFARPAWVDDEHFELDHHVLAAAVPEGDLTGGRDLCARLLERHLDRSRPLWETWLVTGLPDGAWGLLSKVHHCMVDGIAGTDLLAQVLDLTPDPGPPEPTEAWEPQPAPGLARQVVAGLPSPSIPSLRSLSHPRATVRHVVTEAEGLLRWAAMARPTSASPLAGALGSSREWLWADVALADVSTVRQAHGGTVNHVVEALLCSALRQLLLERGLRPQRGSVRSLVPVSVRGGARGRSTLEANKVSAVLADLPVDVSDPVERYHAVRRELVRLRWSGQAEAGQLLTSIAALVPPTALTTTLSAGFRVPHRHLTTVTTNVPGPPVPLFALGRRVRALHPFVPIGDRLRLGFAVTSYDERLWFGITVDQDHVPDAGVLVPALLRSLDDLLERC